MHSLKLSERYFILTLALEQAKSEQKSYQKQQDRARKSIEKLPNTPSAIGERNKQEDSLFIAEECAKQWQETIQHILEWQTELEQENKNNPKELKSGAREMMTREFANWFVQYAGKNHGYNVESSTPKQLTEDELIFLYQQLYQEYGIDNLYLTSHFCETCLEKDKENPYHLDIDYLLDLTDKVKLEEINKANWSEEKIQEEIEKMYYIRRHLVNINKHPQADAKRKAYSFYNALWRVVNELEGAFNFVIVEEAFFNAVYSLGEPEINEFIDLWRARIDVTEKVEADRKYSLYKM